MSNNKYIRLLDKFDRFLEDNIKDEDQVRDVVDSVALEIQQNTDILKDIISTDVHDTDKPRAVGTDTKKVGLTSFSGVFQEQDSKDVGIDVRRSRKETTSFLAKLGIGALIAFPAISLILPVWQKIEKYIRSDSATRDLEIDRNTEDLPEEPSMKVGGLPVGNLDPDIPPPVAPKIPTTNLSQPSIPSSAPVENDLEQPPEEQFEAPIDEIDQPLIQKGLSIQAKNITQRKEEITTGEEGKDTPGSPITSMGINRKSQVNYSDEFQAYWMQSLESEPINLNKYQTIKRSPTGNIAVVNVMLALEKERLTRLNHFYNKIYIPERRASYVLRLMKSQRSYQEESILNTFRKQDQFKDIIKKHDDSGNTVPYDVEKDPLFKKIENVKSQGSMIGLHIQENIDYLASNPIEQFQVQTINKKTVPKPIVDDMSIYSHVTIDSA